MHPAFWKALSAVLLLCILVQQFSQRSPSPLHKEQVIDTPASPDSFRSFENERVVDEAIVETDNKVHAWNYTWERDRDNHGLNTAQCDLAFPELYNEIDRAVLHWKDQKITPQSMDLFEGNDGGVRVLIHDQQLRIIQTRGLGREDFRHRIIAVLQQLLRALTAAEDANEPLPDMEFTVVVDDKPVLAEKPGPLWAFTRAYANPRHDNLWLIPDFHFFGVCLTAPPEAEGFRQMQARARQHDASIAQKIPKVVWRGVEWTNPEVRKPMLEATENQPWADVKAMSWDKPENKLPMDAFCKYRYIINTEGRSWSARMTHILNCDSVVMVHDVEWIAHYYHLLDTDINCVRVERDFSDLEERVRYYNNHTDEAQVVADAARTTFRERYTTPAATACYWRRLLRSWAEVSFEPETKVMVKASRKHKAEERTRGISFEEFIVHDNTKDYPYLTTEQKAKQGQGKTP